MTFVYVLISNKEDFIIEQSLLSIYSLKKHNNDAKIILLVDENTYHDSLNEKSTLKYYVNEIKIIDLPQNLSSTQKSRFIKTSIPEYIKEDFVYLDNDTLITDSLHELDNFRFDIGAIWNQHRNDWNPKNIHSMINDYHRITGLKAYKDYCVSDSLFNGGVLICKHTENTRSFFLKWHELWLNDSLNLGFDKDQVSLWRTNYLFGNLIMPIEGICNCQLIYPQQAKYFLIKAKILHYFSSSSSAGHLKIKDIDFLKTIRRNGINETIDDYIENVKNEYLSGIFFLMDHNKESYNDPTNIFARKLSRDFPFFNNIIRKLYLIFGHRI